MSDRVHSHRTPVLLASVASVGLAVFFVIMAALSLSAGHGEFSGLVGVALVLWGLIVGAFGYLFARGRRWARGPVVAAGLLHVFAFGQFAWEGAPQALLGALAGLVAVLGGVWPSTNAWINAPR